MPRCRSVKANPKLAAVSPRTIFTVSLHLLAFNWLIKFKQMAVLFSVFSQLIGSVRSLHSKKCLSCLSQKCHFFSQKPKLTFRTKRPILNPPVSCCVSEKIRLHYRTMRPPSILTSFLQLFFWKKAQTLFVLWSNFCQSHTAICSAASSCPVLHLCHSFAN